MAKRILLFIIAATLLNFTSVSAFEVPFMDSMPRGTMGAWGGDSSFRFDDNEKTATLLLKDPSAYSGGYVILPKPIDFSNYLDLGYISFQIKGKTGGESLFCLLEDNQSYQVKINLNNYVNITTDWQEGYIPLKDFPTIGENWKTGELKTTAFDWSRVKTIIFQINNKEEEIFLKSVLCTDKVSQSGFGLKLLQFSVDKESEIDENKGKNKIINFSKGGRVMINALYNIPAYWQLSVIGLISGAFYGVSGSGTRVAEAWDGTAQTGVFQDEEVQVSIAAEGVKGGRTTSTRRITVVNPVSSLIRVDQVGYLPEAKKIAFIVNWRVPKSPLSYSVKEAKTGKTVFTGKIDPQVIADNDSGDKVILVDFSLLKKPGRYYLAIPTLGRSYEFEISQNIYAPLFSKTVKAFYFQRCGSALARPLAENWSRRACHLQDAYLDGSAASSSRPAGTSLQSVGGWHDAGDYGKKVVPGALSAGILLRLYEMFPGKLGRVKLDILSEIKYELNWLLTMQREDGAVYHLITTERFPPLGTMPSDDKAKRLIVNVSSTATADFAACLAIAARIFKDVDPQFAGKALDAAEKAWVFLENNPEIVPVGGYKDPASIKGTGKYEDSNDRDERFWAATELFRTTGTLKYEKYILTESKNWNPTLNSPLTWQDVHNFGMFSYAFTNNDLVNHELQEKVKSDILRLADTIIEQTNHNGYRVALKSSDYYWGSNSAALNYAMILIMANEIAPNQKYVEGIFDQLHYILGRNPLNMSYITGVGSKSPRDVLHNPSIGDGRLSPIPGFLVGGPDAQGDDAIVANLLQRFKLPPAKAYVDDKYSYSTNEITVYWNACLAFVVGYLDAKYSK